MALKNNFEYWKLSLANPESIGDDFYIFDKIIINEELSKYSENMRELIISYCVLKRKKYNDSEKILSDIYNLILEKEELKYTEFIAFWKVLDFSYSIFKKYPNNKQVLSKLLDNYCEKRKELYDKYCFSDITIQALYDSNASRKKGSSGIKKIINLVEKNLKLKRLENTEINRNQFYITPDKGQKDVYVKILKKYKIKATLQKTNQGKIPDFLFKVNKDIYIVEAKHVKEGGGEQNKSITELINFIKQSENSSNIHYISFLDGIYFNLFISYKDKKRNNKVSRQKREIERALKDFKQNYFLNTKGLEIFLKDLSRI